MIQTIDFAPGDTISVYQKITEGDPSTGSGQVKTRTQLFEGTVLAIKGRGENKMFTVRKIVGDVAIERIWPINSPNIERVAIKAHPKKRIRRAKLYHLRKSK